MGESNNSFFENVLLKNINEDIPINVDLLDTPEKNFVPTMRTSTIPKTERYIDKTYDFSFPELLWKDVFLSKK